MDEKEMEDSYQRSYTLDALGRCADPLGRQCDVRIEAALHVFADKTDYESFWGLQAHGCSHLEKEDKQEIVHGV